jgi:monoamine oxidase
VPVAVVGAGLAGLTCAYRLRQRGVQAPIYEARPDRVGGRCWTARGFADGQLGEHGGEFIDTDHARMHALVRELGLRLEDREAFARRRFGHTSLIYLDGGMRNEREVFADFDILVRRLREDSRRIRGYSLSGPGARAFDEMSAREWLDANVPGGGESLLGLATRGYLADEFGLDAERLGATNLLYLLETRGADEPAEGDSSDERFHVHGGNDQVPNGLAARMPEAALHLDAPLEALWRRGNRTYGMRFGDGAEVDAEQVVLAIPFTTLRDVDLGRAGLSPIKREAIEKLGMGTNAKLLMQFDRRPSREGGWDGSLSTDEPFLDTWDTSLTQPGRSGLLTVYSGGAVGAGYPAPAHGEAPAAIVRDTLAALERAVPGLSRAFNGRAWLDHWSADPWSRGSYAAYLPGQYYDYSGIVARAEGGIHFAGEHTSDAYQGFLEGAVESGERCAREVINARRAAA